MPLIKVFSHIDRHVVRHVVVFGKEDTNVVLMIRSVEEIRKTALL